MGKTTEIAWCDATFNPWLGCSKVSAGCANCYAETLMDTRYGRVQWGPNGTRVVTSATYWKQPRTWNAEAQRTGVRRRVFCGSLCDVFEDRHDTNAWRISLLELIELTHGLDWLLLTKRPENVVRLIQQAAGRAVENFFERNPHVWIGTSVEDQAAADRRIPHLLKIPAPVRFLSMEPLLGPVDLSGVSYSGLCRSGDWEPGIDWVIVGGESGHNARPMHPCWARSIRDECVAAGVPFFFKQWGQHIPNGQIMANGMESLMYAAGCEVFGDAIPERSIKWDDKTWAYSVGKKAAGRLLDGREWNEFPSAHVIGDQTP